MLKRIKRLLIIAGCLALLASGLTARTVFADDSQPPAESPQSETQVMNPGGQVLSGEVSATQTVRGPKRLPGLQPLGAVYGPPGQWGVLTSGITYWSEWPGWRFQGYARIQLSGGPTARTWTTVSKNGVQLATSSSSPCWTTTTCESRLGAWSVRSGDTALNFAETVIYWSNGQSTGANATVTKTW